MFKSLKKRFEAKMQAVVVKNSDNPKVNEMANVMAEVQQSLKDFFDLFPVLMTIPCAFMITLFNGSVTMGCLFVITVSTLFLLRKI